MNVRTTAPLFFLLSSLTACGPQRVPGWKIVAEVVVKCDVGASCTAPVLTKQNYFTPFANVKMEELAPCPGDRPPDGWAELSASVKLADGGPLLVTSGGG